MTRTIRASEVKPGMEVEFTLTRRMIIHKNVEGDYSERELEDVSGSIVFVGADTQVTVLSEPAPAQPEEPTELGVKARVREGRFLRLREGLEGSNVWFEEGTGYRWTWGDLCEMGPVTVVPDQGWAVPADTPDVPDRIEEWPEDDTALRPYPWKDRHGWIWKHHGADEGYWIARDLDASSTGFGPDNRPCDGPWTRVPHA